MHGHRTKKVAAALLCAFCIALSGCAEWFDLPTPVVAPLSAAPSGSAATVKPSPPPSLSISPGGSASPDPTTGDPAAAASQPAPSALPTGTGAYRVRCDKPLPVRGGPSASAKVLYDIGNGAKVEVTGFDGAFASIRDSDGSTGYVLSGYLASERADPWLAGLDIVKPAAVYSYEQMVKDLKSLAARYPGRLTLESAGKSLQGRDISVAVLGDPAAPRQVLVQGSIHARENMTCLLIMAQIEYCLKFGDAPTGFGTVGQCLDGVCLRILPMTNPDGAEISQKGVMTEDLKAIYDQDKKRGYTDLNPQDYLKTWKANAAGVDLNRNFPAGWEDLTSASSPSSWRYKGAAPGNQPESKALMQYTEKYKFDATVSYHATGGNIYWEYGSDGSLNSLSHSLAIAVRTFTQYKLMDSGGLDSGGYKDWAMGALGIPSVTIEIGSRECPLPFDEFSTVWARNLNVPAAVAEWVKNN